ncbi:GAF domain-containing protein [Deinococcus aerophilus]|uniref:histidine kinase n=1 Tax=Deinococcus aerophilus TaxID=522488 RepID=A0ABQ2GYH2_9DEIO|nr:GAF domain-containing protein [Deinococcus aerophilus]GGM20006.1 hypothetical protein GCM10010841_30080 [Deinococcus aerophilus]
MTDVSSSDPFHPSALRATQLMIHLQGVTQALAAVRQQDEVFDIVLRDALDALGGISGAVLLVQDGRLHVAARSGQDGASVWQAGDLEGHRPSPDALRSNTPLFFGRSGDLATAYPELEARTGGVAAVASAVLPMVEDGRPLGVIVLDFREPHDFNADERRFLTTLAGQCALALDRAQLSSTLERQIEDRTAELAAFVRFTEVADSETDVLTLAARAGEVLSVLFPSCSSGYYVLEDGLWKLKVNSRDLEAEPALLDVLKAGMPLDIPVFGQLTQTGGPVFVDAWNPERERLPWTGSYRAVALYPLVPDAATQAMFAVGLKDTPHWTEPHRAVFRSLGRSLSLALERTQTVRQLSVKNAELQARTLALEGVARLTHDLSRQGNPAQLIEQVLQLVFSLLPAGYASFWEVRDGRWQMTAQLGDVGRPEWQATRLQGFGVGQAPSLDQPYQTRQPLFQDHYDPARDALPHVMDHLLSMATLPVVVHGTVAGVLGVALFSPRPWGAADRALLTTLAQSLGLGLERAEQLRQLEAEGAAREAFAAFTEAVGTQTDVLALARQAFEVLRGRFAHASAGYYEREGELWKARAHTDDLHGDVLAMIRAGLPSQTPMIARMLRAGEVVFTDAWDSLREELEGTEEYGKVANYPLMVGGEVQAMLSIGLRERRQWSGPSMALVRAVGRGLTLALERSATARRLEDQNAELQARTQALEGFAELTRDLGLTAEPSVLIRRAMELVLTLLPPGYAAFWQILDGQWHVTTRVGEVGKPELQAALQAGLAVGQTPSLDQPHHTREPLFQDHYDPTRDIAPELADHVSTLATLPVLVNGKVAGIFSVPLFGQRAWSAADQAVLRTTVHSLGLALERAEHVRQLQAQRDMLQAANEELEAFTYSVSHDLRTPVRHIVSFGSMLRRSLPEPLDEKTVRYASIVETAAVQLNGLIDGMLDLSRTSRQPLRTEAVDLGRLVEAARKEIMVAQPERRIDWRVADLPTVVGDAGLLRRVVATLMNNAVKYTRPRELAVIEVWAEDRGETWAVLVRDNGVGFAPQYGKKLFTVFQRLHRQQDFEGAGVSLASARRVVTRHGGTMMAEGQPDAGATFGFTLPKTGPEGAEPAGSEA